jgi:tetratricopeptide (TPR) repeat protein
MTNPTTYDYDVFISYNQIDESWAKQLATRLEQEDWQGRKLKVFFAPWDIKPGDSIPGRLEYALPRSRKVCLIMSPESADSGWVQVERYITHHFDITEQQTRMIPLYRRACEIPPFLHHINRIDFQDDAQFEDRYRVLLATIKNEPLPRGNQEPQAAIVLTALIPRPPLVGFVARRDSEGRDIVEHLKEELAPQKNQLVVLSGPGGVGKTTLAAETARSLVEGFGDRIVWIGALGREDFALSTLLDEIATQLRRADLRSLAPALKAEQIQALLASAPTLIILDNFETIAPAEQAACVEFLLHHATCPALITTRQRIPSAWNIAISVMSPDEAEDFLQRLIEQASDPSAFAELDRDGIMKASERNPLVLQWVVVQIDLAQEAHTVLEDLAHGEGDAAQRVFDRSFGLEQLGDDGRAALLALSLFAPDASRAALTEVAGFGEDENRLNEAVKRLSALWLLKTTALGSRLTVEGLTRELAKARLLCDGPANEYRTRFVTYFQHYSNVHSTRTAEDYDFLEAEKDNLVAAVDLSFKLDDWESTASLIDNIAAPVTGVLAVHGYWDEAARLNAAALEASRRSGFESDQARYAHNLAVTRGNQGELDEARRLYHESLDISKRLGNQGAIAQTLHQLAFLAQGQGETDEARRLYHESLEIKKILKDQGGIADTQFQLARLAQDQGELDEARRLYHESLEIAKQLGNLGSIASTTSQLGIVHMQLGETAESKAKHEESLAIRLKLGDQEGTAIDLHQLAQLAEKQGKLDDARHLYHESLEIDRRLGNQGGIAITLHNLAGIAQNQGELDESRRLYHESLEIKKRLGNQDGIAITLHNLAGIAQNQGELDESRRLYHESLEIKKRLGNQGGIAITLGGLGLLAEHEGHKTEAARLFGEALAIFEKLRSPNADWARRSLERVTTNRSEES